MFKGNQGEGDRLQLLGGDAEIEAREGCAADVPAKSANAGCAHGFYAHGMLYSMNKYCVLLYVVTNTSRQRIHANLMQCVCMCSRDSRGAAPAACNHRITHL